MTAYRLVVTDRGQRLLRQSFALYLAPQVIDKMLASNKLPALGGETRDVTVFFSDLAGFSSIAEQMTPTELVAFMNEYLSAMTDIIESKGGYVDKYIGDSIVAVFGAPVDDADHARHAARPRFVAAPGSTNSIEIRPPFAVSRWRIAWGSIPARRWSAISARGGASTIR